MFIPEKTVCKHFPLNQEPKVEEAKIILILTFFFLENSSKEWNMFWEQQVGKA